MILYSLIGPGRIGNELILLYDLPPLCSMLPWLISHMKIVMVIVDDLSVTWSPSFEFPSCYVIWAEDSDSWEGTDKGSEITSAFQALCLSWSLSWNKLWLQSADAWLSLRAVTISLLTLMMHVCRLHLHFFLNTNAPTELHASCFLQDVLGIHQHQRVITTVYITITPYWHQWIYCGWSLSSMSVRLPTVFQQPDNTSSS